MKKRVKQGRSMMIIGMFIILGLTLFRAIPSLSWTLSAIIALSAFGLIVAGLLLTQL
ncbi:MAG TPA: hypothetical protein VEH86_03170 [Candidatus Acidoferrum sp.]|nr:hypothetical protein [Candidatus Acidoferrum sp.]